MQLAGVAALTGQGLNFHVNRRDPCRPCRVQDTCSLDYGSIKPDFVVTQRCLHSIFRQTGRDGVLHMVGRLRQVLDVDQQQRRIVQRGCRGGFWIHKGSRQNVIDPDGRLGGCGHAVSHSGLFGMSWNGSPATVSTARMPASLRTARRLILKSRATTSSCPIRPGAT